MCVIEETTEKKCRIKQAKSYFKEIEEGKRNRNTMRSKGPGTPHKEK